ncbi:MAG: F0F1 ATP synthase subunit delta [Candidatus Riflebacteria bacterium]|jgi:F-type H+-transporting ATPase subunit delta|nr:F0F1 ATP synthase subunit delta [Candidatus Riflebacteria bacterium]MBR6043762.1 F0F1 ATP synthase subunit delta [Paludibacteraceae bacterium]
MDTGRISVRYAKALLEVAQKNGSANKVYEEMESVSNAFFAVPDLKKAMNNPHVTTDERKKLLLSAAGNESSPVSSEFSKFVDLVTDRKRENYFHSISLVFQDLYRKDNNIIIGKLTTATEVSEQVKEKMKALVAQIANLPLGGKVEFQSEVDPSLIGGFQLQVESNLLDASVASQLQEIKKTLIDKAHSSAM